MKDTIKIFAAIRRIAAMRGIAIIALVAVMGFGVIACDDGGGGGGSASSLTIYNNGSVPIYWVYISPSNSTDWGNDWLSGNGETISTGSSKKFQLNSGTYDVRVRDSYSNNYYKYNFPISGNAVLYYVGGSTGVEMGTVNTSTGSLPAPTGLTALAYSSSSIQLFWDSVPGAERYNIYSGTSASSLTYTSNSTINTAVASSLSSGTIYYYQVAAVNQNGTEGQKSNIISAETLGTAANFSIDGIWIEREGSQIEITGNRGIRRAFSNYIGPLTQSAIDKNYLRVGDQVLRSISSTGALTWSAEALHITYNTSNPTIATGTRWTDTGNNTLTLSDGGQTLTRNGTDSNGPYTQIYTRTWSPPVDGALTAPTGVNVTGSGSTLTVSWSAVTGATGYMVYISSADGFFVYEYTATTTYSKSSLAAGTYSVRVSAFNDYGEGEKSNASSVTIGGGSGSIFPAAPTGLTATALSTTEIGLTWNAVPGAAKYNIYRSTNYGSGFSSSEWPDTSARHTNLTPNSTWYYKVAAVNASGREGEMSETVSATTLSGGSPDATWDKLIFGTGATSSDTATNVKAASTSISGEVVIPSINKNGTARITSIIQNGFSGCTDVTSIELPETLTTINSGAFNGCTGITSITIPASVTTISGTAFNNCTSLISVTFLGDAASISSTANTFPGDLRLKYMAGGAGTYTRTAGSDTWATEGGSILDTLTPSGTSGNVSVKAANSSISGAIVIPETIGNARITSIANAGFQGCTGITGVTLPNSITAINANAFSGCTGITSITIPATVTTIGGTAFNNCTNLTSVTFMGDSINSFSSTANTFPGDLRAKFTAAGTGGHGTYTRTSGGTVWTKQ